MGRLDTSVRLKVKADTLYVPYLDGSVYFHNNVSSFWMEGDGIEIWLEKLLPLFNGNISLGEITDGLAEAHQQRVYDIAQALYHNGFAVDVSGDPPHQLSEDILLQFSPQIELIDSLVGQGASRFETYRMTKVLVVADDVVLPAFVASLFESGLPVVTVLSLSKFEEDQQSSQTTKQAADVRIDTSASEDGKRLCATTKSYEQRGFQVQLRQLNDGLANSYEVTLKDFDVLLFAASLKHREILRQLESSCRQAGKTFLPAVYLGGSGVVGPVSLPPRSAWWASMWQRIHADSLALTEDTAAVTSGPALGMLVNVLVFELFKQRTGLQPLVQTHSFQFYGLNFETLEGDWHGFLPYLSNVTRDEGVVNLRELSLSDILQDNDTPTDAGSLLGIFAELTSPVAGVLHLWDEGALQQLPLSVCRVQASAPKDQGPAGLLPATICFGMTHEEARREAGLTGLAAYTEHCLRQQGVIPSTKRSELRSFFGVGIGGTRAEAFGRGLHASLLQVLYSQVKDQFPESMPILFGDVNDQRCEFYLKALQTLNIEPKFLQGPEVYGFPSVFASTQDGLLGSVGFTPTLAVRPLLEQLLFMSTETAENKESAKQWPEVIQCPFLPKTNKTASVRIVLSEEATTPINTLVQTAVTRLKSNNIQVTVLDAAVEPFLQDSFAGAFLVVLREGACS